jgi:DNA invertase Pin-like site-specific DNA recombinase
VTLAEISVSIIVLGPVTKTLNQQQDALGQAGVSKTFSDTMSGARDDRPGLADMLAYVC